MSGKNLTANGFFIHSGKDENGMPFNGIFGKDIPSPLGRIAFVNLAKPSGAGKQAKYGLALLVDKNDEEQKKQLDKIRTMAKLMAVDFWGDRAGDMLKKTKRKVFGDGDEPSSTGKIYEGYPGNVIINARNKNGVGNSKGFKILNEDMMPEQFESGMICRLLISPYLNADGFSYNLKAVKLIKDDGIRFGGAPDNSSMLDGLDDAAMAVNSNISHADEIGDVL